MPGRRLLISFKCLLLLVICCLSNTSVASTRIEIVIDEPVDNRQVAYPLTTGIPFPRGALSDQNHCRLLDDRDQEQPLQSRVTATWDEARKSIRWLTIDFIAAPGRKYCLEFGDTVQRGEFPTPLNAMQKGELIVTTGPLEAEFSKTNGSALRALSTDLNANGVFEADEIVVQGDGAGDHYYTNQNADRFSSALDKNDREIVVEANGPVRTCIRVDGFYTGPHGERIVGYRTRPVTFLTNGPLQAWSPWKLPSREWAHVAVEWRPLKRDPSRQAVHIYVDGHDQQNYRSTWWEGYSQKPKTFRSKQEWLKQFLCKTQPGAPFLIDELRISNAPRYAKTDVILGGQQTFNPARFDPPTKPFDIDPQTLLLMHFDDDLAGESSRVPVKLEGRIVDQ